MVGESSAALIGPIKLEKCKYHLKLLYEEDLGFESESEFGVRLFKMHIFILFSHH